MPTYTLPGAWRTAANLLQIPLLDHVIIGQPGNASPGYFSFREAGMIA
jgi:DNA repair protein RadC